uniref:Phosphoribosylamine-glycine ligase/phosphoribosylformylglycinamide cyclo-ligase n=1 Tax=Coremiostelium polycephalum TaxID=142831 RepID=A0A1L2FUS5_9MYCE|nr:phosphoribosylamine-glycine ligase/phosphoribosylformylglycinamide cyclo-ligase [Coremiostelium polycephalum]|eukprot:gene1240-1564_t
MVKKNVIVIGSGSREHAISWKLLESEFVDTVVMVPGNASSLTNPRIKSIASEVSVDSIVRLAKEYDVDLVVVGPEQPLVDGLADGLKRSGVKCFGPLASAAEIEGSKVFSKDFMKRHSIPTARYENFSDYEKAVQHINTIDYPVVIKASGCAAGKGVLIPKDDKKESIAALKRIMVDKEFKSAGDQVVIEEFLDGEECSLMCFSDGYSIAVMPPAQDHKRIFDGDLGPNTGGMGAYAPAPFISTPFDDRKQSRSGFGSIIDNVVNTVLVPTINAMRKEKRPFVGVLFAGLMVSKLTGKVDVLEFNCRMGDPETQVVLPLLSSDLYQIFMACVDGCLDSVNVSWKKEYCVNVVAASKGYPDSYPKGLVINGLDQFNQQSQQSIVFHAGTIEKDGKVLTNGGRVLSVTSQSNQLELAIEQAYQSIKCISFDGMQYRKDIGMKALNFLNKNKQQNSNSSVTYSESGVDIERGDAVVTNIASAAKKSNRSGTVSDLGGFGALFDPKAAGYVDPILVSGTDGVGTKLKVAQELDRHSTIGQDLVAMCVNDIVVQGAEPLFFLDYFATGKIHVDVATNVISGIADACRRSGCALIGGETAEMPGMYKDGEYDLAGFAVGAVERTQLLPANISEGDVLLGLASSGVHSNGYSLVRYLVEKKSGLSYRDQAPFDKEGRTIGDVLLTPTKLYVLSCLSAIKSGGVHGLAHITGGGITENLPRVIPNGLDASINLNSWEILPIFQWLRQLGNIDQLELLRTFNCGLGMILIVSKESVDSITKVLVEHNETVFNIGTIIKSTSSDSSAKVVYK